jgi:hypothetical protein
VKICRDFFFKGGVNLGKEKKEKGFKPLWETKMLIWERVAAGDSDDAILDYLSKHNNFNVEDRYTVRKIKKSFSSLDGPDLEKALSSDPSLINVLKDERVLAEMAELFKRAAFTTPFQLEESIPDFKEALKKTIFLLTNGFPITTNGKMKLSKRDLHDPTKRIILDEIIATIIKVRNKYEYYRQNGEIGYWENDNPKAPMIKMTDLANREIYNLRKKVLDDFRKIYPAFDVDLEFIPVQSYHNLQLNRQLSKLHKQIGK